MERSFQYGNAERDGAPRRGWFVGRFIAEPENLRGTSELEIKWGVHSAGENRESWGYSKSATTMTILIKGKWSQEFADGEVELSQVGDYIIWSPYTPHRWVALEDSIMLTVRWPSVPDDNFETDDPQLVLTQ